MLLAFASAPDRLFLLELTFDAALPGTALLAHEFASSTLVFVQLRPREPQVPFLATFYAGIRLDVSRAETSFRASQAHRVSFVPLGMTQHVLVELVPGQYLLASVAAAGIRLALALDAVLCFCFEGS